MQHGILLEVKKGKATLLTKDGCFVTVKVPRGAHPVVGMEYKISRERSRFCKVFLPSLSILLGALLIYVILSGMIPFGRNEAPVAAVPHFSLQAVQTVMMHAGILHVA
ncbi:hypothetical protein A374_02814 [Fictibacillus macauensis ZFHKF-1]|uniref:RsgI N-terminal anti-sigma domain-containing protein n=1 Tax=Fictibacillus macauensis ZFHKF-1 TaxID=1196324 RepID=I8UJU6_9BACL|nr:anti-sigma factor domain-containing protein [Fictibacillus macauensis]EIT87150.1 hypothetical protein A374_02814 [Fictibacillus macauensis ZFHKF-1]